jgi:hypothetical protein
MLLEHQNWAVFDFNNGVSEHKTNNLQFIIYRTLSPMQFCVLLVTIY